MSRASPWLEDPSKGRACADLQGAKGAGWEAMTVAASIIHYAILHCTILHYTILYYTILYHAILYYTILYYTILYYTILYYRRTTSCGRPLQPGRSGSSMAGTRP